MVGFTDDQQQFQAVVDRFLADKSPPTEVRRLMATDDGFDADVWAQLANELGLTGTHLPEAYGGFGFGPVELGIALQGMGRHLYCGPYFSSCVMGALALLKFADETHKARLLPEIANGSVKATLVLADIGRPVTSGLQEAEGRISGEAKLVLDAHIADRLLVIAETSQGAGLYDVAPQDASIRLRESTDPTRKLATVTLVDAPATPLGSVQPEALEALWDEFGTALAHEMVGGAERLFETTIEYMKMRVQFGRAIGSFQALKHRCADLLLELELARGMTHAAARFLATGEGDAYAPNMAKSLASDAYISIAKQAIQLRGGIGFTWEEDTHLWFKRAKSSEVFLGTSNWHRERMMKKIEMSEVAA